MKTYHLSWLTKDETGYHGHWMHITAETRKQAVESAELALANNDLVKNGAGTYFNLENLKNCKH